MRRTHAIALALSVACPAARAAADEPKPRLVSTDLSSVPIDPAIDRRGLVASPDGSTVAYPAKRGDKVVVFVEGKAGPELEAVGRIHMGENGKRVSYWGRRGGRYGVLVVDGVEHPVDGGALNVVEGIAVSSDGSHVACVVERGNKARMLVDGKDGKEYDAVGFPLFSPDGKRLAYHARKGEKLVVVVDGQEGPEVDGVGGDRAMVFSPDGKRFGYAAQKGEAWVAVIDGVEGKPYERVDQITLSAAGTRHAYAVRTPEGERVVLDGVAGEPFHLVGQIAFSPDGKRTAVVVRREFRTPQDQSWTVVVDGKPGKTFSMVSTGSVRFSADSKHVAYVARQGGKWVAVLDDAPGAEFDGVQPASLALAPDGSRVAYAGRRAGKWHRVVGSREAGPYDAVAPGTPRFGPDGARTATFVIEKGAIRLLIDDLVSDPLAGAAGVPVFDGPNAVRVLVLRDTKLVRQRIEVVTTPP